MKPKASVARQENQHGAYRQDSQRGGYRQEAQRGKAKYAPKGYGNVGCYDEEKYLNDGKPLNGKSANIRDVVAAARAELREAKNKGAGFFKDKKKKSFNPNFDSNNRNKRGKK